MYFSILDSNAVLNIIRTENIVRKRNLSPCFSRLSRKQSILASSLAKVKRKTCEATVANDGAAVSSAISQKAVLADALGP